MAANYTSYRRAFADSAFPLAYIDLDLLDANIAAIAVDAAAKKVRIASKSVRSVAVLRYLLESSENFEGVMCFTAPEAVALAEQGFDDLLVAYPTTGEAHIRAAAHAVKLGHHIMLMIDSIAHVERIEAVAADIGVQMPLCLDMDASSDYPGIHFGVWRSALRSVADIRPIIAHILASEHVYLDGIMGYEAQIAGLGDNVPGKAALNRVVTQLKKRSVAEITKRRTDIVVAAREMGCIIRFVNGGGTGSLSTTTLDPSVTEVTVGSGFYSPVLFDHYLEFKYQPAAGFAVEIVRQPRPDLYTCLGGGYIASGETGPIKQPLPYLPAGAKLTANEGAGEVQTPVEYSGPETLLLGDPIFMRHSKAGELCERFTHLHLLRDGAIVDKVTTYRGDGHCFL